MEISNILTLNTTHIKQSTSRYLNKPNIQPFTVYPTTYGWFIYTQDCDNLSDVPPELAKLILLANDSNCTWLQLDSDGPIEQNLETFEWSEDQQLHTRMSKQEYYLNIANAISKRSTCLRRHYGCVIVNNDEIVSTGYNGAARNETNCCDKFSVCPRANKEHNSGDYSDCHSVHAEQNALLSAARNELNHATLYLNGEEYDNLGNLISIKDISPCPICMRMIKNSGISNIVTPNRNIILQLR